MMTLLFEQSPLFLVVAVVGTALLLARLLLGKSETLFERRTSLLPPDRAELYRLLHEVVEGRWAIHWDVCVRDLLQVRGNAAVLGPRSGRLLNRHADYVICHADSLEPCVAIFLQDAESTADDPDERRLLGAFNSAGLPLIRLERAERYEREMLRKFVEDSLAQHAKNSKPGR